LTGSCALAGDGSSELPVLRILNWSDYIEIDEEADASLPIVARSPILREFAARHGCEIDYHEFEDSTEVRALRSMGGWGCWKPSTVNGSR